MMGARWRIGAPALLGWLLVGALSLATPRLAVGADGENVEGWVVAIQDGDIVVDVAKARGARDGDVVELWRPIELRHPVTGKKVKDRFRIGSLRLAQVRSELAIARAEGALDREPEPGDVVLLRLEVEAAPAEPVEGVPERPGPSGPPVLPAEVADDPEAIAVASLFEALRGQSVTRRVKTYEDYVRAHSSSPYARTLYEEATLLRELYEVRGEGERARKPRVVSFAPPGDALAGRPLTLAVEVAGDVNGALLHTRVEGEASYSTVVMKGLQGGYYATTLPAERMVEGRLDYVLVVTSSDGGARPVLGSAEMPLAIDVRDQPLPEAPESPRATVAVWTDYADYNRMRGNDTVWQTEGFFGMRFGDTGVRALRSGFGVYRGVGGSLEELDELELSARQVGLTYGYLEMELGFAEPFSLILRGAVGLLDEGVTGGGQAFVRIGSDLDTNLQLGAELLGGVGLRGIAQLELNVFPAVPILLRTEVTNQPAGMSASSDTVIPEDDNAAATSTSLGQNDIGGRGVVQVGYRFFDSLMIAARGSYQGRTIKHSGPGFGGAVSYTW